MEQQRAVYDWRNVAGPIAAAYEASRAPMNVIIGPTGAGKTQSSARKPLNVALWQHPSPRDGVRKARIACVAPTYPILWDTAIRSFRKVFPDALGGKWTGSSGRPADYSVDMSVKIGGKLEYLHLEVEFRSISDKDVEEFMRGREVTGWWFPEMDQADMALVDLAANRIGRYPEPEDRPENVEPAWAGIFGDSNAPVTGSAFFQRFYVERALRRGHDAVFVQPPGILEDGSANPNAENLHNLRKIRPDYYAWLAAGMADYDIGRLLKNRPGYSRFGRAVHESFNTEWHVAKGPIAADAGLLLEIGADAGQTLKPAAVFTQRSFSNQRRFLAEISPVDRQIDLTEFGQELRRIKDTQFGHVKHAIIWVDPSAGGASITNQQMSYAQMLQGITGIEVRLAPSNKPDVRRTAMDQALKRTAGPGEPGVLIDPIACPRLIEGLAGGYRFKKIGDHYSPMPEKNDHSHEAEAGQYVVLGSDGLGAIVGGFIPPQAASADAGRVIIGD